jgi:protein ImuB
VNSFAAQTEEAKHRAPPHRARTISPLRMMRPPLAVRIGMDGGAPAKLFFEGKRFAVRMCSGPWRTSGAWWTHPAWCREEWDVVLSEEVLKEKTSAEKVTAAETLKAEARHESPQRSLRLAHDPAAGDWYVLGMYD